MPSSSGAASLGFPPSCLLGARSWQSRQGSGLPCGPLYALDPARSCLPGRPSLAALMEMAHQSSCLMPPPDWEPAVTAESPKAASHCATVGPGLASQPSGRRERAAGRLVQLSSGLHLCPPASLLHCLLPVCPATLSGTALSGCQGELTNEDTMRYSGRMTPILWIGMSRSGPSRCGKGRH